MIISSAFSEGAAQADGRRYVKESHIADDGQVYSFEYLAHNAVDRNAVLVNRAAILNAQLAAKAEAAATVNGTTLPLTPFEFKSRMTGAERKAVRNRAKSNDDVADFLDLLATAQAVYPTHADVQNALALLVHLGDLTPVRAAIIGAE